MRPCRRWSGVRITNGAKQPKPNTCFLAIAPIWNAPVGLPVVKAFTPTVLWLPQQAW